ncbi:MAG: hypothetical protein U0165_13370 [Polyangiaceae bacterium]
MGLAGVFASASNAPLALSIMAVELVGVNALPHAAVVCVLAYLFSGHRSIYPSQRDCLSQDRWRATRARHATSRLRRRNLIALINTTTSPAARVCCVEFSYEAPASTREDIVAAGSVLSIAHERSPCQRMCTRSAARRVEA